MFTGVRRESVGSKSVRPLHSQVSEPVGALAHLQLGRAYVLAGDKDKARGAYKDFLTLWKDADPDIPVLKQAEAEYAQLQ